MSYLGKGSESLALTSKLASGDYKYKHIIFNQVHYIHTLRVTVGDNQKEGTITMISDNTRYSNSPPQSLTSTLYLCVVVLVAKNSAVSREDFVDAQLRKHSIIKLS